MFVTGKLIVLSDVGFLPIFVVSRRFPGGSRRRCWRSWYGRRLRELESSGMDWPSDGTEETQTVFQIPDARTRKGISIQRLRVEAETVGARAKFESDRATGEDMVSKSTDEK